MNDQGRLRVLLAEDDFLVSQEIARMLETQKFELAGVASNGNKAVSMCASVKPDVVLMDIKMPRLSGLEAAKAIQRECPTPIVILSAHETEDFLEDARKFGIGAYLTKPPLAADISRAITLAVACHSKLMEARRRAQGLIAQRDALETALADVKTLEGFIPICANCKSVRDDNGLWQRIEAYLAANLDAEFTHGICPACVEELYPESGD